MERYGGSGRGCCRHHHHQEQEQPWRRRRQSHDVIQSFSWPPRSYSCSFCKREFRSAQALGGHMNVHRRDRAMLRNYSPPPPWDPPSPNPNPNPSRAARIPNLNLSPPSATTEPTLLLSQLDRGDSPTSAPVRDREIFEGIVVENSVIVATMIGGSVQDEDLDLELRLGYA